MGDESWICQYCNNTYKNKGRLKQHEGYCLQNPNRQEVLEIWIKKLPCPNCGREIAKGNAYNRHVECCINGSKQKYKKATPKGGACQYCGRIYKDNANLTKHENKCKNLNPADRKGPKDEWIPRTRKCEFCGKIMYEKFGSGRFCNQTCANTRHHTAETKQVIREARIEQLNDLGANGWGIKGWYKGIHCDSSYELIYLVYCLDHNINIRRNKETFKYIDPEGIDREYLPDFYLPDEDCLIEIKGRNTFYNEEVVNLKLATVENCNRQIKILYDEDIFELLPYFRETYNLKNEKQICEYFYDK